MHCNAFTGRVAHFHHFCLGSIVGLGITAFCHTHAQGGYTALMFAAGNGHTECVRLLVRGAGIGIDAHDNVRTWQNQWSHSNSRQNFYALFQTEFK